MANIAIFRINYKSDFILTLNSDAGWMTPFCIKFWTGAPSQAYFVGYDGETYTNCAPVAGNPTKLAVQFDDHHLPIGDLKFQIGYHFTVADFPTAVEDEVINQAAVIIDQDGTPMQVMLDLNGETAPEIQFSLPAYANEAQRIANEEQRIDNETQRIGNEETRIQHEESRIAAEQTRQQNEQQRINQEQARVNEFAVLKRESEQATTDANNAAENARQKAQLAQDKATLAQAAAQLCNDKAALAQAAAQLANDKAQLAADKAALAQAASQLCDEKAALAQQKATYAQQQGDYSKAQGDYAKEQGDYSKAQGDYSKEQGDYSKEQGDYAKDKGDICAADHQTAVADHQTATADHQTAAADHQTATTDHNQAGNDHTRAESDHTRAESDHAAVELYVDSLGVFDLSKHNAVGGVLATYADLSAALTALNALDSKYKYGGMSFKFVHTSDNNYVQYRLMTTTWSCMAGNWQEVVDGQLAVKLQGVTAEETKVLLVQDTNWYDDKYVKTDGKILDNSAATGGVANGVLIINVSGYKKVRFLGFLATSSSTAGYGFSANPIDPTSTDVQLTNVTAFEGGGTVASAKEYLVDVPDGMNYFACTIRKYGTPQTAVMTIDDFYCYVQSGFAVGEELALGGVFDVTAHNSGATFASLSELLNSQNLNTLIPLTRRKSGMGIKFKSGNNYIQFRYILSYSNTTAGNNAFKNPDNWQGVDKKPVAGSKNLPESGGVYERISYFDELKYQGYINNGVWTSIGSGGRYYSIMEYNAVGTESYKVKGNSIGAGEIIFLSAYNPVNGQAASIIDSISLSTNEEKNGTIPVGTKYIYIFNTSGAEDRMPAYFYINDVDIYKNVREALVDAMKLPVSTANYLSHISFGCRVWGDTIKPNVDTVNKKLVFGSESVIYKNYINELSYTIPANTEVALTTTPSGSVLSTLIFDFEHHEFSIVDRSTNLDPSKVCVLGFYRQFQNDKPSYYFVFDYTIDGKDVQENSKDIASLQSLMTAFNTDIAGLINLSNYTPRRGYINGTTWDNVTSEGRKHIVIPVVPGDKVVAKSSVDYILTVGFLSAYNVVEDGNASVIGSLVNQAANTEEMYIAPANSQYLYFQVTSGSQDRAPQKVSINGIDAKIVVLENRVNSLEAPESILDIYSEKDVLFKLKNLVKQKSGGVPCVTLLHFSDLHGRAWNMNRIKEFVAKYSDYIDDVIHTGDLEAGNITQNILPEWDQNYLSVIGNHDATYKVNDVWTTVDSETSYNKLIAPFIANWNVVQPAGAGENGYYPCYYYKDYDASKLRLIVLDNMQSMNDGPTHWDATQKTWFEARLADTLDSNNSAYGYHVVVAFHYPAFNIKKEDSNPWRSKDLILDSYWFVSQQIPEAVKTFIASGGKFVCYLCGHTHRDLIGVGDGTIGGVDYSIYNNQLCVSVATAGYDTSDEDFDRTANENKDAFNLISFDTNTSTIKIMRVGSEYDRYMRRKNVMSWDYANSRLIYLC